jgi:DNA transformation protein and related proteins
MTKRTGTRLKTAKKTARPNSRAAPRAKLTSLRVSNGFREFVLGQLAGVRDLRAQAMFGGIGLYSGDVFFGIVAADVLYFKVGATNRAEYERAGSKPLRPYADRAMKMRYYNVPIATLEDAAALEACAERAIAVAKATTRRNHAGSELAFDRGIDVRRYVQRCAQFEQGSDQLQHDDQDKAGEKNPADQGRLQIR